MLVQSILSSVNPFVVLKSYAQLLAIRQFCLHNKCLLRPHKLSQFPRILVQNFLIGSIFAFQKRVFEKLVDQISAGSSLVSGGK